MSKWSTKWHWVARSEAWDQEAQRRADEEIMRERQRKAVEDYLGSVLKP
jgi:hypothetical protein